MPKQSAVNLDITNNTDGFDISGGVTPRKLTVTGGDITVAGAGLATITFPTVSTTLAGLGITQSFTVPQSFPAGLTADNITVIRGATFSFGIYVTGGAAIHAGLSVPSGGASITGGIIAFGGARIANGLSVTGGASITGGLVGFGGITFNADVSVVGNINATTKSFVIPHPTKQGTTLRYGSLEGPENGVYVRGMLQDCDTIELPEYWRNLVDENTITVNLTPIGSSNSHFVKSIGNNQVMVGSRSKKINCFYIVFGERKDVPKLTVEY